MVLPANHRATWIRMTEQSIASMCAQAQWDDDSASEMECHAELQAFVDEWFAAVDS